MATVKSQLVELTGIEPSAILSAPTAGCEARKL